MSEWVGVRKHHSRVFRTLSPGSVGNIGGLLARITANPAQKRASEVASEAVPAILTRRHGRIGINTVPKGNIDLDVIVPKLRLAAYQQECLPGETGGRHSGRSRRRQTMR